MLQNRLNVSSYIHTYRQAKSTETIKHVALRVCSAIAFGERTYPAKANQAGIQISYPNIGPR